MVHLIRFEVISTGWGAFGVVASERGIVRTYLPGGRADEVREMIRNEWPEAKAERGAVSGLGDTVKAFFAGQPIGFDVELDLSETTAFEASVIAAARRIPYGETVSYSELARSAGSPRAARAVGTVMAGNRFPLIVPCHRVVRSDGTLGGFSAPDGVDMKRRLLALEGHADMFEQTAWRA